MTPGLIERHFDYVLGPNQDNRLASVAAGQTIEGINLGLDADAPFVLRSRAVRVQYNSSRQQAGLGHVLMKWAGPDRNFRSQDYIRQVLVSPYCGQIGNPMPVWPPVLYPRNSVIRTNVRNDGTSTITNLTLYFRGVKLFAPGSVRAATYPPKIATLPFCLPQTCSSIAATQGAKRFTLLNQFNKPISDADFVIWGAQMGVSSVFGAGVTNPVNEVFITLLDEDEKPYSNDAVHIDVLFGNGAFGATFPVGSAFIPPIGTGPRNMGLFYPEIYIERNHVMYYDVSRNDGGFGGSATLDIPLTFIGQKVFTK